MASYEITSPVLIGNKKSTESVEAVTTGALLCFIAQIAAISSILAISKALHKMEKKKSYLKMEIGHIN